MINYLTVLLNEKNNILFYLSLKNNNSFKQKKVLIQKNYITTNRPST